MSNPYQYNNYRHSYTVDPNRPSMSDHQQQQQQQQQQRPTNSSAPPIYYYQPNPGRPAYGYRPYNHYGPPTEPQPQPYPQQQQQQYVQQQQNMAVTTPLSSPGLSAFDSSHGIRYVRNKDRQREINHFTTQFHCLDPVSLLNKSQLPAGQPNKKGRKLFPLYKVNEDWIAPSVGMTLENRPGYRCLLYVVSGTLIYDNGLSGDKLMGEGTLHLSTTSKHVNIYAKNPSRTHRAHIMRFWIDAQPDSLGKFPDAEFKIRHMADSDMQNTLVAVAQPLNYRPTYGMTEFIYGPLNEEPKKKLSKESGFPLDSLYQLSQSTTELKRPDYFVPPDSMIFTPPPLTDDNEISVTESNVWSTVQEPGLNARVCADPFLVTEDIFIAVCRIDPGSRVVFEPFELLSSHRQQLPQPYYIEGHRANRRRVWVQTLLNDLSNEAVSNGGRLVLNGDMRNRVKPGGSAYIRKMDIQQNLALENCGSAPLEFMLVETPY